jgi:hypothetical protein
VARVEIQAERIAIKLVKKGSKRSERKAEKAAFYVPWKKTTLKRRRELIAPASSEQDVRPIRSETRVAHVTSIASGRRWLDEILTGNVADVEQIAAREKCSVRQVNMTISLAFLSPTLVKAAIDGRLPRASASLACVMHRLNGHASTPCSGLLPKFGEYYFEC